MWNFCPQCGKKIESDWKHFPACGLEIGRSAAASPTYIPYPVPYPVYTEPAPVYPKYPQWPYYWPYITWTTQQTTTGMNPTVAYNGNASPQQITT